MSQLVLKNVRKSYGDIEVIKGVDLDIKQGEFCVFVGPSGCGKSTLLRMIAGLEDLTSGDIEIDGTLATEMPPSQRGLAMVFQSYALYPHMTVRKNIAFPLRMAGMDQAEIDQRVDTAAKSLNLLDYLERKPADLSGGQRQRVAIGRAIVREPAAFLFDEPLSNLDAALRVGMRLEIGELHERLKTTMIYVTHDQVEAMSLADRISVMHQGRIVQAATPVEVYRNPAERFVAGFIGNPPMNFLPAERMDGGKWQVAGNSFDGPAAANGSVEFAIRPEDIAPSEAGLPAKVRLVEPLGAHLLVTCDVDGTMFRAVLESDLQLKAGDMLNLAPQTDRIRWFDTQTSLAVA